MDAGMIIVALPAGLMVRICTVQWRDAVLANLILRCVSSLHANAMHALY
jgi:hypothetical protein